MGNKKISELNLLTTPQLSTIIPVVEGGETQKLAVGSILNSVLPISASSIVASSITVNGTITANNIISQSIDYYTGSTNHGTHPQDNHTYTGSVFISGSETITGDLTVSGNLFVQYETELGGNIVPRSPRGATLGTVDRPFSDIFVSSGSINIASDIPDDPNTTLSNIGGNILVSAGGMRLIESGNSFIAETGSFQYLSASFTHVGSAFRTGDTILIGNQITTGSLNVSGSTVMIGNNTMTGSLRISGSGFINNRRILTDLDSGSFTTTSSFNTLTASFNSFSSSVNSATSSLYSFSSSINNTTNSLNLFTASINSKTGSWATTGSNTFSGSQGISGSLYVSSSLNITDGFYVNGNKQFNYGQFSDTTTQSGSANTSYSMKFNTTDIATGFSIVSGSRITAVNTGIYNLQFSAQLDNASNTNEIVDIWIAVTGSNIPNSNTTVAINKAQAGNIGKLVAAWNYMIPLSASQYVELKWSSNGGNIILLATGSASNPTRPATPSVIATITQVA